MDDDDIVIIDDIGEILTEDIPPAPFVQQGPHKPKQRLNDSVTLFSGDCLETMRQFADNCIDAVVTDPPYELGFMGKKWDKKGIAFQPELWREVFRILKPGGYILVMGGTRTYHRLVCAIEDAGFEIRDTLMWVFGQAMPKSRTGLKPAHEMICLARKPLSEKTVAANVLMWGTGALNIDGCRIGIDAGDNIHAKNPHTLGTLGAKGIYSPGRPVLYEMPSGRWPPNLIHDGSPEVVEVFPDGGFGDSGSTARFFPTCPYTDEDSEIPIKQWLLYCAKANKQDRNGSKHPTIKPIKLMQWLCRLITPPGGCLLDPFAGSGTTGTAAVREGFQAILCENEPEYQDDICRRLSPELLPADDGDVFTMVNTDIILDETAEEGS